VTARFVPPHPPRGAGPVPVWRGLIGERARTAVYGWSEAAFTQSYMRRRVFGFNVHIPLDPDLVQHVLLDNVGNYGKPALTKSLLGPLIGRGLLTADGSLWREQRRIVAGTFVPAAVDAMVPIFARVASARSAGWAGLRRIEAAGEATAATMAIISESLFAGDPRLTSRAASAHIAAALDAFSGVRLQALLGLPRVPLTPRALAGRRGQVYLRETLTAVVRDRAAAGPGEDFLGKLIADLRARYGPEEADALAVDNAATFYLAGHETTANAMTWLLFLLSEQHDWQERVADEARAALAEGGDDPRLPDRLPLLRRVLDETLRLYPSAPRMDRQAAGPDRLGSEPVEAGDIVSLWPWLLHRHKGLWDDPDAFDPDRFAPERKAGRHRFQYIPFGGGPRTCVGARFATAEGLTILAHWLARWRFRPVPGHRVVPSGMVTLRPRGGLPLLIEERR